MLDTDGTSTLPIGIIDSGAGGLSALAYAVEVLPHESFLYYADCANAPYGDKTTDEIIRLTLNAAAILVAHGIKALLIACNTATSAAVATLRESYTMPIIGMEPALKPACLAYPSGTVAVMATNATLKLDKFSDLVSRYANQCRLELIPCPGLMELIEKTLPFDLELMTYLRQRLCADPPPDAVVIGCTHYSLIHQEIRSVWNDVHIFDGTHATIQHLQHVLENERLLSDKELQKIDIHTSGGEEHIMMLRSFIKRLSIQLND